MDQSASDNAHGVERGGQAGTKTADTSAAEAALHARLARKRTKTGCLTCRRRRIKCDESKPICGNCHKSRRLCEGYNQRVLFKPADIQYLGPDGAATITFHASMLQGGMSFAPSIGDSLPHPRPELRPREPLPQEYAIPHGFQQFPSNAPPNMFPYPVHAAGPPFPHPAQPIESLPNRDQPPLAPWLGSADLNPSPQSHPATNDSFGRGADDARPMGRSQQPTPASGTSSAPPQSTASSQYFTPVAPQGLVPTSTEQTSSESQSMWSLPMSPPKFLALQIYDHSSQLEHSTTAEFETRPQEIYPRDPSNSQFLEEAAIEQHDDDYWDIQQGDDTELEITTRVLEDKRRGILKEIVEATGLHSSVLHRRGFETFIYDGILDSYRPQWAANPLRNPYTARVFAHFISATGPLLTIFVRQTRVPVDLLHDGPLPLNQQGLWTYIMPMAALHHQGLLQAILAISSLHIAKLQRASETPSLKHYGYALKRIHRSVRDPTNRHSVVTLAATLLLAYYEILAANHTNWNTHVAGAKQLIIETDYAHMTRVFKKMKAKKALRDRDLYHGPDLPPQIYNSHPQDRLLDQIPDVDEATLSLFSGIEPNYEDHGRILDIDDDGRSRLPFDLVNYETFKDLFWWYCKQDIYQCILSGNHLMLDLSRYTDCPPRAPLNDAEAVYGSFDHLMILLARIGAFGAADRKRKLKVMQANGGAWRPAPGMQIGRPPGASASASSTSTSSPAPSQERPSTAASSMEGGQAPAGAPPSGAPPPMPFYGMAPAPAGAPSMPASYQPPDETPQATDSPSPPAASDTTQDLASATEQAIQEWNSIKAAADYFASAMGPMFQPLGPEYQQPQDSPYGPVIFYRSWDIACVWAIYNLCLIILIRGHPHMPPAAHMAAGVAAQQTREIALTVGRIAAGIPMPPESQSLNPHLAAALSDLTVPLFFAGIQFQAPDQRIWLLDRLYAVDRRAGWATARRIAEGCQTAWIKAAAAGRGPPHERMTAWQFAERSGQGWHSSFRRADGAIKDVGYEGEEDARKFVLTNAKARLRWGIGIIGQSDDVSAEG